VFRNITSLMALMLLALPPLLSAVMLGIVFVVLKFALGVDLDWNDPNVELWGTILAIPLWLVGAVLVMKWSDVGS
jgi:hypothetical protein